MSRTTGSRDVDAYVRAKVRPEHQAIVAELRRLVGEYAPGATEEISYGIPAWRGKRILAVISPTKKDITLAFSRGAEFADRHGLLRGAGRVSKHIKIKDVGDINKRALRDYVRQALKLDAE